MRKRWMRPAVVATILLACGLGPSPAEGRQDLILSTNLDGTSVQTTLDLTGFCGGISLDPAAGKIYFTDLGRSQPEPAGRVERANLDGSDVETLIAGPTHKEPYAVAFDPAGNKVYWTDRRLELVRRANPDGTELETLIAGSRRWVSLALDPQNGKLYVGDSSNIYRADLDGNNYERVVYSYYGGHRGIAVDSASGKVYWTESSQGNVKRANLDGSDREILVNDVMTRPYGIALDLVQRRMYWTDWRSREVRRANLDGSDVESLLSMQSPPYAIDVDPGQGKLYVSTVIIDDPDDVVVPAASTAGAVILAILIALGATARILRRTGAAL